MCYCYQAPPWWPQSPLPQQSTSLTDFGCVEPLFSLMRSTKICNLKVFGLLSFDYLVHDFEHMCQKLKPTSKRILIDMGHLWVSMEHLSPFSRCWIYMKSLDSSLIIFMGLRFCLLILKESMKNCCRKSISQPTIGLMLVSQSSQIKSNKSIAEWETAHSLLRALYWSYCCIQWWFLFHVIIRAH